MASETTVAIYVRVSSVEQAERGWSLDGQVKECREYCDTNGFRVVRLYRDAGFSATTLERPMLQKMLEHAAMGVFERIIVWKYDRLSRNNMDFPALLHFFNKQGIEVCSVREPTPNDGSPYNEFVVGILGLVSSLERRVLMMRTEMGVKTRLEKGYHKGTGIPLGYNYNTDTGYLEIDEAERFVVELVFHKYLEIGSICTTRNWLNKNDVPTKKGSIWHRSTVRRILGNRVYLGEYTCKDITTMHPEARIISDEIWEMVQVLLAENSIKSPAYYQGALPHKHYDTELNFDNTNPELEDHLNHKSQMPPCPRCQKQLSVQKWGYRESPTWGRLQQYYCKTCNYEFTPQPEKAVKNNIEACPECHSKKHVRKEGWAKNTEGRSYRKYYCGNCYKWFRGEYETTNAFQEADSIATDCHILG